MNEFYKWMMVLKNIDLTTLDGSKHYDLYKFYYPQWKAKGGVTSKQSLRFCERFAAEVMQNA